MWVVAGVGAVDGAVDGAGVCPPVGAGSAGAFGSGAGVPLFGVGDPLGVTPGVAGADGEGVARPSARPDAGSALMIVRMRSL